MRRRFNWFGFRVTVTNVDHQPAPWGGSHDYRDTYRVTVSKDGVRYTCLAWGSIANAGREDDHKAMGAMVLDELCSAYCDPDEFWQLALGEKRPARERVRQIEKVIDKAAEFGEPLTEAVNSLRKSGVL